MVCSSLPPGATVFGYKAITAGAESNTGEPCHGDPNPIGRLCPPSFSVVTKRLASSPASAVHVPRLPGSSSLKWCALGIKNRVAEIDCSTKCGGLPPHDGQNSVQKLFRTEWFCEVRLKTGVSRALPVRVS